MIHVNVHKFMYMNNLHKNIFLLLKNVKQMDY